MARYVDIDKYNEFLSTCGDRDYPCVNSCTECYFKCNNGEIEDVAPVIHAKWIEKEWAEEVDNHLISNYECSNCKEWVRDKTLYCPHCGAKMDKE